MGTLLSEVSDLFLTRISDYRIDSLFQASGSVVGANYTEPWLLDAIDQFNVCTQDLTYTTSSGSVTEGFFTQDLTSENKNMLSRLMVQFWLAKEVMNLLQMSNFVTDRDFRTFSAAQNISAKQTMYNGYKEEMSQALQNYAYKHNESNFKNWYVGVFDPLF